MTNPINAQGQAEPKELDRMKTITLTNSFHNTSVRVRTNADNPSDAWFEIQAAVYCQPYPTSAAKAKLRRVKRALCGVKGCRCGIVR